MSSPARRDEPEAIMSETMAPLVIVLMGVSGCGKSTTGAALANALGWPFRDADSFHPPANIAKMSQGLPLDDEDRAPWLAAIARWIDERCERGEPGIVSCSALKRAYRQRIIGERHGVRLVYLRGGKVLIGRRLEARKHHFMPASLLDSQFTVLEEPRADEQPIVVSVAMSPRSVVDAILAALRPQAAAEEGT
jgi:gluconokinase